MAHRPLFFSLKRESLLNALFAHGWEGDALPLRRDVAKKIRQVPTETADCPV